MGRKREIKPRERYFFEDWMFHETKEISKEEFYEDVIKDIDNYIIRKEENYYYFEYIDNENPYEDDEDLDNINVYDIDFDKYFDDFKIIYECENPSEDIVKEIEKKLNKS